MSVSAFMELVEARTKLASILPFLVGVLFAFAYFGRLDGVNTALFFVAMLLFDMTTTAINNLMDYQKAKDATYQRETNVIGRRHLAVGQVTALILGMLGAATVLGLVLVWRTDWLLLLIGAACFVIGIFYTFGPLPLSRLPLGEVFSGVTMGLGIPFIAVFINVAPNDLLGLTVTWPVVALHGDFVSLIALFLVCVTPMATIANVMLANNLSDIAQDTANHRMTLPMYLGQGGGVRLWQTLTYSGYVAVVGAVLLGALTWPVLVTLLALPLVARNANRFAHRQDKARTFPMALRNLMLENGGLIIGLALSLLVKR
ncbi:1,4-dihydroxy-2-naphthoate polyprenyltransferase [Lacticaseibacillus daqingensis]|uniref:1,4-dihydroxy-2-naphthoate polyprenyltransferase n=1 Tax=Lacticaseibacillus daqingensis TaxID=2486014 RepID=UPI000F766DBB|nr:1,4-dihydroxy-2-naphthoate polyprenyltransferase [Lacticaseibacillus daqingensis]